LRLYKGKHQSGEFVIFNNGKEKRYAVHFSALISRQTCPSKQVMVIYDVTERRQAQIRLIQKQQSLAVIKEREWLARELHDNLSQVLGFVSVQAQAIDNALAMGQNSAAGQYLKRLTAVAQEAQMEIREFIQSVKTTAKPDQAFFPILEQYLKRFSQNYNLPLELITEGVDDLHILPGVRIQLPRIIQEALNNARKHASAKQVRVVIANLDEGAISVMIEDDGCGFDPDILSNEGKNGFGLQIMAERAEDAGCSLHIDSAPGQGTRVMIRIPIAKE